MVICKALVIHLAGENQNFFLYLSNARIKIDSILLFLYSLTFFLISMIYYYCLLIFENIRDTVDRGEREGGGEGVLRDSC